jgi:hypothetical protein
VSADDPLQQLREQGVALLRDVFAHNSLTRLKAAATACFQALSTGTPFPAHYRLSRASHSVLLAALIDFGCESDEELAAPLSTPGLERLFAEVIGDMWTCNLNQSWARQKFAPGQAQPNGYHLQDWHQDGALGVSFPLQPSPVVPMTELLTCWIPLIPCGVDSPGLEFIRRRQPALLHFTELDDALLRRQFAPHAFWAPALDFGDGLIFRNDVLHRTHASPEMRHHRLSVEYRIFPG